MEENWSVILTNTDDADQQVDCLNSAYNRIVTLLTRQKENPSADKMNVSIRNHGYCPGLKKL